MTKPTCRHTHYSGNVNARNHIPRSFIRYDHVKNKKKNVQRLAVMHADEVMDRINIRWDLGPIHQFIDGETGATCRYIYI